MNTKKRNNKGFTLVELLAILIILAIIAVLIIPKITTILDKSKKDAAAVSALGYTDAVEKYYVHSTKGNFSDEFSLEGEYIVDGGVLKKDEEEHEIEVNGTIPEGGFVNVSNGVVVSGCLTIGKYAVIVEGEEVTSVTKNNCPDTYTITFNSNGGSSVSSIKAIGGRKVTKPANPTKVGYVFKGWFKNSELTQEMNFDTGVTADTTLYAKWGTPSFAYDSWAEIKENLTRDRNYYPLGSEKTVPMNLDGETKDYIIRLVNTSTPEVCSTPGYSQTACGIVLEFLTTIGTSGINTTSTNDGSWYASNLRQLLNYSENNYYSKLPDDLKAVMIPTYPIVTGSGSGGVSNTVQAPGDYLYLLSTLEVGYTNQGGHDNRNNASRDTRILDWYNTSGSSKYNKYATSFKTSTVNWWLRTPSLGYNSKGVYISNTGSLSPDYCNVNYNITPAFRIGE